MYHAHFVLWVEGGERGNVNTTEIAMKDLYHIHSVPKS